MGKNIGILVGSARKESFSGKLAETLIKLGSKSDKYEILRIDNLSIFNQDYDAVNNTPEAWTNFREKVKSFDAFILVTPEYNRSVPALLKNALDIGSRPYGKSVWDGKPAAVVSNSPGALGGFGANHHLRQTLSFLNMPTMTSPEAYIGNIAELIDDKGNISSKSTVDFLQSFMNAFALWINKTQK